MKKKILYISLIFLTFLLILNPSKTVAYAKTAMDLCQNVIIPSLFPFFVCSGLLIHSGMCETLAKLLQPIMKPFFNVNGAGSAAFILGIISGYPLGAVTACQLYEKSYLSKTEAERLLTFCNNSGPLFILGAVGISLYHNPKIGIILYITHIISALLIGFCFRFYRRNDFTAPTSALTVEDTPLSQIFSTVLANSLQSILTVCGTVLFFSVVSALLTDILPLSVNLRNILVGFLEFTSGIQSISQSALPLFEKLVISAAVVGFAGIGVHMQVISIVSRYGLDIKPYILGKSLQAVISALTAFLLLRLFPGEIPVFSAASVEISGAFAMNALFVILTVVSAVFIILAGLIYALFARHAKKSA